ncbi:MAG: Sir2 family NAD-dependent protein deacetylase [Bacteroidota bacterium]
MRSKLVVLTGAGISAESGLSTFRDAGGLWDGYNVYDVASIDGWNRDPEKVLEFYNLRRSQAFSASPNEAHLALAEAEQILDVSVITQNVDQLHERAGSSQVIHLHGELSKARSSVHEHLVYEIGERSIHMGDKAEDGSQLRPHIVWFGEAVPMMDIAIQEIMNADALLVIGTSLTVYPAAGLIDFAEGIPKCIVDTGSHMPVSEDTTWNHIQKSAAVGTKEALQFLFSCLNVN